MRCAWLRLAGGDRRFAYPEFSDVAPVPPKAGASGRAERGLARGRSAKCEHRALARAERFCGTCTDEAKFLKFIIKINYHFKNLGGRIFLIIIYKENIL